MDAGTTAGAVLASTVRVGVRARVNGKGRSSTFSRGGAAICTNGAARNCALPRCVGAGSSRGHGKHRLHVPATFQLGIATPAASGGEGFAFGLRHACLLVAGVRNSGRTWPGRANEQAGRASLPRRAPGRRALTHSFRRVLGRLLYSRAAETQHGAAKWPRSASFHDQADVHALR